MKQKTRKSIYQYLSPSDWPIWLILFLLKINSKLSYKKQIIHGKLLGRLGHKLSPKRRAITRRNLALAFPELPLYLSLVAILPRQMDPFLVFIFMAFILSSLKWAQLSREVRGKTLSLRRLDYIKAAEALGSNDMRIIVKHLLPNVTSHVIVSVSLLIPSVILTESFFSFLGLGIQSPFVSWGLQLNSAQDLRTIGSYPWVLSPVFAILISVLGFNAFGDALRDAIDPYATTAKK